MLPKIVTTPPNVTDRRPCVFRVCWHSRPEPRRVERAPPTSETAAPAAASEERAPAGRRAPRGLAGGPMALTACHSAHPPVPSGGCVVRRMGWPPFFVLLRSPITRGSPGGRKHCIQSAAGRMGRGQGGERQGRRPRPCPFLSTRLRPDAPLLQRHLGKWRVPGRLSGRRRSWRVGPPTGRGGGRPPMAAAQARWESPPYMTAAHPHHHTCCRRDPPAGTPT